MLVHHLGDLGRKGGGGGHGGGRRHWGGGRRHWGGGGGYYPYYADPYPYVVVQEPVNKYVIIDPNGKPIAVVTDVGKLPPGFTFRQATPAEAATNSPMSGFAGFGQATPYPVMVGKYRPLPGEGMRGLSTTFVTLPDDADIGDFAGGEESLF